MADGIWLILEDLGVAKADRQENLQRIRPERFWVEELRYLTDLAEKEVQKSREAIIKSARQGRPESLSAPRKRLNGGLLNWWLLKQCKPGGQAGLQHERQKQPEISLNTCLRGGQKLAVLVLAQALNAPPVSVTG